jgi:uncharacterized protein (DUF305 family)
MKKTAKFLPPAAALWLGCVSIVAAQTTDPHHPTPTPPATTQSKEMQPGQGMGSAQMPGGGMMGDMMKMMQEMHGKMMGGGMGMQPRGDTGPSSQAFNGINAKMHQDMAITFSGNADVDFAKSMIPHHQGVIDMAKVELAFGKDPEIKKLADSIIKAQEGEIELLKEWLKKEGQ